MEDGPQGATKLKKRKNPKPKKTEKVQNVVPIILLYF